MGEERIIENGPFHLEAKLEILPQIVFTNTWFPGLYKELLLSFGFEILFSRDCSCFQKEDKLVTYFISAISWSRSKSFLRNGLPYNISKSLSSSDCGVFLIPLELKEVMKSRKGE